MGGRHGEKDSGGGGPRGGGGRRTGGKIRRKNIKIDERIIEVPAVTHKIRNKDQFITITEP